MLFKSSHQSMVPQQEGKILGFKLLVLIVYKVFDEMHEGNYLGCEIETDNHHGEYFYSLLL